MLKHLHFNPQLVPSHGSSNFTIILVKMPLLVILGLLVVSAIMVYVLIAYYHFHVIQKWPFLIR